MIKITPGKKGLENIKKRIKAIGAINNDSSLKAEMARFTRDMVYKRVKSGKGVNADNKPVRATSHQKLKKLSKNYVTFRKTGYVNFRAKKYFKKGGSFYEWVDVKFYVGQPALGEFGAPARSNLTFTGQMLKSMTFDTTKRGFVVLIPATRRREGKLTNSQLAIYLSQGGRPFMALTAGESRILKSNLKKAIQKRMRKLIR